GLLCVGRVVITILVIRQERVRGDETDSCISGADCRGVGGWVSVEFFGSRAGYAVWTEGTADSAADVPYASRGMGGRVHAVYGPDARTMARRCHALANGAAHPDRV